ISIARLGGSMVSASPYPRKPMGKNQKATAILKGFAIVFKPRYEGDVFNKHRVFRAMRAEGLGETSSQTTVERLGVASDVVASRSASRSERALSAHEAGRSAEASC